jgi:hypothetical protein
MAARPPAAPPQPRDCHDLPAEPAALRQRILDELDGRSNLRAAAGCVARYFALGHPLAPLIDTLTEATVREDLDFHTLQTLDAAVRQVRQTPDAAQAANLFVAVIRALAAVCPTPRAGRKVALTAYRLHHGEQVYLEE